MKLSCFTFHCKVFTCLCLLLYYYEKIEACSQYRKLNLIIHCNLKFTFESLSLIEVSEKPLHCILVLRMTSFWACTTSHELAEIYIELIDEEESTKKV